MQHNPVLSPRVVGSLVAVTVLLIPLTALAGGDGNWEEYQARGWVGMFLGAFGFGFLTSLTPCVYPMIPIVVGVFGARDEDVTRKKAFALATLYVLGMGMLFATLGLVFAMVGKQTGFGSILANPWVVIPIVTFYAILAASMFGAFELNLPTSWQSRLNRVGGKGYLGAFGLGLVGGLTAAPCTGPFLAGMLAFVAASANPAVGFSLLFTYALGIGVLFWVIAVFAVSMPKSGRWMEWVKSAGGVALLAAGGYFLRPIVPAIAELTHPSTIFLLGAIVVALVGLAIGAVHLSFHDPGLAKSRKGLGLALMVIGITGAVNWALTPERHLPWVYDEEAAFAQARAEGKGVMVDFAANYCTPCKELELTFAKEGVFEMLAANYVPLKLDVSEATDADDELQDKYRAASLPAVIFLGPDGTEYGRISQYVAADEFMEVLRPATDKLRSKLRAARPGRPGTLASADPPLR